MKFLLSIKCILVFFACSAQNISESDLLTMIQSNQMMMDDLSIVIQEGNYNHVGIDHLDNQTHLIQTGNYQDFYYMETSITPSNLEVNMQGNGNYLEVFGNNQISENMRINIVGDHQSIIIRNYP